MRAHWMLAVFFVVLANSALAFDLAEPYFESVGDSESIPDNNVSALATDATGFIWIGTPDGLIRYDGYRFRYYGSDADDPQAHGGDFVRSLLSTRDGRLWVGTNADGVSVVDPATARVQRYRAEAGPVGRLSNNTVRALAEDASGGVWIGTREGLDYWDPTQQQLRNYRQRLGEGTSIDDEQVIALAVDQGGDLWIGSWGGLSVRRSASTRYERVTLATAAGESLVGQQIQALLVLDSGAVVIGTARTGTYVLNPERTELRRLPGDPAAAPDAPQPAVLAMLQPQPGTFWLAAFGGIDVVDASSLQIVRRLRPDPAITSSLAHDQVRAMLRDRAGQIWVGGYGGGLQRTDPANVAIGVLRHSSSRPQALSSPSVSSVLELESGEIWVGLRGNGIDVLDRQRGVVGGYRPNANDPHALRNGVISSLAQTQDGVIWAATIDGLHRFDPMRKQFARLGPEQGLPDIYVRRLLAGRHGELWIGTDAGLARYRHDQVRIEHVGAPDGTPIRTDVNALIEATDGRLWVGSSAGLFSIAPGTEGLQRVTLRALPGGPAIETGVIGLLIDRAGQLWADTPVGLNRINGLDGNSAQLQAVSARLGAVGVPFGANLLEDASGRIWSQRFVYDPHSDSLYELGRADGADLGTPWFRSYAQTRDGLMLFGGSKGLMVVDPSRFVRWQFEPALVVTEIKVGARPINLATPSNGFSVSPEQRGFSVEFSALDFTAPQRNRYQYRLDGFDRDWIDTDASRRVASYNSLSPGTYMLHIRGSNRTGVYSGHELTLPVRVIPAFWQTWWFKFVGLLFAALALVVGVRLHNLRIRRRAAKLERLVAQRTAELTQAKDSAENAYRQLQNAQQELVAREKMASLGQLVAGVAHEINTPVGVALTASSYLSERSDAIKRTLEAGALQRRDLADFITQAFEASTMIGQNLTRASDLVRSFKQVSVDRSSDDRRRFDLHESLKAVVRSMELTWKRRPVRLDLQCDERIELDSYPGALGQVITNLIQNALLHAFDDGRSGTMRLSAAKHDSERVRIRFEDDGNGIGAEELARVFEPFYTTRRAQGGSGLGLHIVYNLVTVKLGGRIEASGEPGGGMRFLLTIPISAP